MSSNLAPSFLDQLTDEFGGETLNRIASAIGQTPAKTQSALAGVLPALMAGLASKASTTEGATDLLDAIRRSDVGSGQLGDVAPAVSAPHGVDNSTNTGKSLLDGLFGGRVGALTDWVSSNAGINRAASGSLLSLALPVILGALGKRLSAAGGGVSGLMNMFGSPESFLQGAPAGLASALGLGEATPAARPSAAYTEPKPAPRYEAEPRRRSMWAWLLPLLLALAAIALVAWMASRQQQPAVSVTPPAVTTPAPPAATAPATAAPAAPAFPNVDLGAFVDTKLPNGTSLHIPTNGVENRLLAFIGDASLPVDNEQWFSFDRLEFETGSAQLRPSSQEQLRNVAEILEAYPEVNLKIGGYTDNSGNAAGNLKLSADRATNTMNALVALGVDKARLAAEGYGAQHPVADNATEEGRQRNRRIDVRVTKK